MRPKPLIATFTAITRLLQKIRKSLSTPDARRNSFRRGAQHVMPSLAPGLSGSIRSEPSRVVPGLVPGIHADRKPPP
jgi:hypothetical protein